MSKLDPALVVDTILNIVTTELILEDEYYNGLVIAYIKYLTYCSIFGEDLDGDDDKLSNLLSLSSNHPLRGDKKSDFVDIVNMVRRYWKSRLKSDLLNVSLEITQVLIINAENKAGHEFNQHQFNQFVNSNQYLTLIRSIIFMEKTHV